MIENPPRKWDNIKALSASQSNFYSWIPAFAGMTTQRFLDLISEK